MQGTVLKELVNAVILTTKVLDKTEFFDKMF